MKERPILFSAPMVRAVLDGTKTQTRREVVNRSRLYSQIAYVSHDDGATYWPHATDDCESEICYDGNERPMDCPYGAVGDRLWVRETFGLSFDGSAIPWTGADPKRDATVIYRASFDEKPEEGRLPWKPSIFMPRWASRITLAMVDVRVERLQDISEADAVAEGVAEYARGALSPDGRARFTAVEQYRYLWESINGAGSWDANPWVWALGFKVLE